MGFTYGGKEVRHVNHPLTRVLSLPPSHLLKDPLAPVRLSQHFHSQQGNLSAASFHHGVFHERLCGPLGSLHKPLVYPTLSVPVKSPKLSRRKERFRREAKTVKPTRGSSFVLPSTDKENVQVKEAYRRGISSDGSWSGDLIKLSSALDQLASLCHKPNPPRHDEFNNNIHSSCSDVSNHEYGTKNNEYGCGNKNNEYGNPKCLRNSSFKSHMQEDDRQDFYSPLVDSSEWVKHIKKLVDQEDAEPGNIPKGRKHGVTRKMTDILRALGVRLAAWGRTDFPSFGHMSAQDPPNFFNFLHSNQVQNQSLPCVTNGSVHPRKVVVALYDYNAAQAGDLSLMKNEEYVVLDDSEDHWWKMRDSQGHEGYAPSNYVREKGNLGLQQYDWYLGDASRQRAEAILMREEKEGCFVVRNSTTNSGIYTLSVFSKMARIQVKHYHIKTDPDGLFYLSNSIKCPTIPELIYRHQHNPGGLCTRLRNPPSQLRQAPTTAGLSHDKWEIVPSELNLLEELGSGQFGVVRHGKLYGMDVAVKMMKEGTMSEDEFIEEAKVMTKLQHPNLVQLYGVCRRKRPIYIVTEYLKHGSLLNYMRSKEKLLIQKTDILLDMCVQVCEGMAYLESQKFIHRDLAARNCLVGSNNVIKVGDFGLARYVVDDEYTGSGGAKFPIKWAAPEVLNYMRFSSKSDVWAFAVLMWEVFTCGKMPYGRHKNAEVVELVQQGKVLDRPRCCPVEIYEIMRKGWTHSQEQRPGFHEIRSDILRVVKTIAD